MLEIVDPEGTAVLHKNVTSVQHDKDVEMVLHDAYNRTDFTIIDCKETCWPLGVHPRIIMLKTFAPLSFANDFALNCFPLVYQR